jgi:hypothetical protein
MESSYVSARPRAIALMVLVIVQLVLLGLALLSWAGGLALIDGNLAGAVAAFGLAAGLQIFDVLVLIAACIVFLTWVHRAIANLPALHSRSCRFSPSSAVWSFFIPFVNLVRGHQIMATIWTDSQPAVVSEHGYALPPRTTLVSWWWGLYLFSGFASLFVPSHPVGIAGIKTTATATVFFLAVRLVAGVLFVLMIRAAQRRQDEQWLDLERRRQVPVPTADALR